MKTAVQKVEVKAIQSLPELTAQYFLVASCWNNYKLAVKHKMSVEKAIRLLRRTRESALQHRVKGRLLAQRSLALLQEIVERQEVNPDHEKAMG